MTKQGLGHTWRQAAAYSALVALGLLSIGCSKKAATTSTETPTMTVWQSDFSSDSVEQALSSVGAKTVKLTQRKLDPSLFEARSVDAIAADEAPDVWIFPDDWLEDHKNKLVELPNNIVQADKNKKNSPENLQDYFKKNYGSYINDHLLTEGGAIAFPGPIKPLVLFVNRKLFSDAYQRWYSANNKASSDERTAVSKILNSPLSSWGDVTNTIKYLTQRDGDNIAVSAIALGTANNVPNLTDIFALLDYQQGNDFVDIAKQTALFNGFVTKNDGTLSYPGRDALGFITQFSNTKSEYYTWNANMPNAREAFLDGRLAMLIDYPDFQEEIKQNPSKIQSDYLPMPQLLAESSPVNVTRYYVIAATKASSSPSQAITLAQNLASSTLVAGLVRGNNGSVTPYTDKISDTKTTKSLAGARFVYKKHHQEFDAIINRMVDDVSIRGQAIDVVINKAANDITALLQRDD